jgi:hypothetical protein
MGNTLRRLAVTLAALPRRILRTFGWGTQSDTGGYSDADEIEARRRREREAWRQGVDETDPPAST